VTSEERIREEELHAFIDGELSPHRAGLVTAALEADPVLAARVAAFAADKAALAAAFRPLGQQPVPAAWIARIQRGTTPPPMRRRMSPLARWAVGLAASLVMTVGAATALYQINRPEPSILAQAESARLERNPALIRLTGAALADARSRDDLLTHAVGLQLRTPDLAHLGWRLVEIDTYPNAAALRYRAENGDPVTMFVRRSIGTPRFDLLKIRGVRVCIWQDDVVGAVIMGKMSAGRMMRVAAAAYAALNL
jgi:anti-sigma factor RsiW